VSSEAYVGANPLPARARAAGTMGTSAVAPAKATTGGELGDTAIAMRRTDRTPHAANENSTLGNIPAGILHSINASSLAGHLSHTSSNVRCVPQCNLFFHSPPPRACELLSVSLAD